MGQSNYEQYAETMQENLLGERLYFLQAVEYVNKLISRLSVEYQELTVDFVAKLYNVPKNFIKDMSFSLAYKKYLKLGTKYRTLKTASNYLVGLKESCTVEEFDWFIEVLTYIFGRELCEITNLVEGRKYWIAISGLM